MKRLNFRSNALAICLSFVLVACASSITAQKPEETTTTDQQVATALVTDLSTASEDGGVTITVEADAAIPYTVFQLKDPMRLIVDMSGVDLSGYQTLIPVNVDPVDVVRPYFFPESSDSRLEIDLKYETAYRVDDSDPKRLLIYVGGATPPSDSATESDAMDNSSIANNDEDSAVYPEASNEEPMVVDAGDSGDVRTEEAVAEIEPMTITDLLDGQTSVRDIIFESVDGLDKVTVAMSLPDPEFRLIARKEMNRLTIDLPGATIKQADERILKVDNDQSKIRNIAAFQFRGGNDPLVKIVVNLSESSLYNIFVEDNKVYLEIGDETVLAMASQATEEDELVGPEEAQYTGTKINLNFQKADIHNILRILADVAGYNVITSDNVKGKVTMKLNDVPWDQALEVILKNNGLDMIKEGNIIRVATVEEVKDENEAKKTKMDAEKILAPLFTRIFEINYETALNMKANLASIKSERGQLEINERTNSLIAQDTKEKLIEMASLIESLDKKEQQVLIESRIVEITHNKARELGIQWGGYYEGVTGYNYPNTVGITGTNGSTAIQSGTGGNLVNVPITDPTGAIGLTLGHINGTALLDAQLMAMEETGEGRLVSMPRITTMNNKEAQMESGEEVPYQTISSEGTKTEFKDAKLKLKVTPHITPDDNVRMEIEVNKDTADFTQDTGAGPPIRTKQAKTEVLVGDGETTVIGGLFQNSDEIQHRKVPGFADIPFMGWLFKSKSTKRGSEELLIFITPKIVD